LLTSIMRLCTCVTVLSGKLRGRRASGCTNGTTMMHYRMSF
jgi:hypothetical protein